VAEYFSKALFDEGLILC